ncbi:hypothetical protein D9M68_923350 [compost metagenome]
MEQRLGKTHLVPAEVGDGGAQGGVAHRDTDHQPQGEGAVDQALTVLGVLTAILLVQVQLRRVMGDCAEPDVVAFGDGAADGVLEHLPHLQFVEIKTGHEVFLVVISMTWEGRAPARR